MYEWVIKNMSLGNQIRRAEKKVEAYLCLHHTNIKKAFHKNEENWLAEDKNNDCITFL